MVPASRRLMPTAAASRHDRRKLLNTAAALDGLPVLDSIRSAQVITRNPALTPSQRNGSASHGGERWPTHGSRTRALSLPVIRSASVRPARLVVDSPSPT